MKEKAMLQHAAAIHHRELLATTGVKLCGFTAALLPFCIGIFLFMSGSETFEVWMGISPAAMNYITSLADNATYQEIMKRVMGK